MKPEGENKKLINELKRNSFSAPDGYFDELEKRITSSISANTGNNPFTVPPTYFHNLPFEISNKISARKSSVSRILQPVLIAASLIAAVLISSYFMQTQKKEDVIVSFDDLKNSDYLYQLNETEIIEMFSEADIANLSNNNSDHIDFLIDNDIDINQIETN